MHLFSIKTYYFASCLADFLYKCNFNFVMQKYPIYAGGKFLTTSLPLEVYNSYTNQCIAETYLATTTELELAIEKAQKVEKQMKEMPVHQRYEILMDIAFRIKSDKKHLAEILAQEACKPIRYALAEIDRAIQTFIIAAEESKRLPKEYFSLDITPAGNNKEGLIKYFPLGLIAGIAPFNFPLNLAVHKIAPALAAGNCIILKPARSTPLSTLELAKIIDQTSLPKGAFSVLPMDRESGNQLVTDERFKMLTFTGSPEVGWNMKKQAGKKKITLELGGNAGVIVSEESDLELAVNKCVGGAFAYSGQVCIHVQRIYVQQNVFHSFCEQFVAKTQSLKIGDPLDETTDISAMIDEENAIRVENWVNESQKQGATILCGGKRNAAIYLPTVLTGTQREMNVCKQEIFGPVVVIEPYSTFESAIEMVNDSMFGLQAGVFTNRMDEMNMAFAELEVGGVIINDAPTFRVDNMPYGGVKNSGFGREGVKYAIAEMMEPKLLVKNF